MTVTVGFAAATTPGLVTGGTTAAAEDGAPEGLFAALLAMLAPAQVTDAAAGEVSEVADKITSTEFGALIQTLAARATSPVEKPETDGKPEEVDAPDESLDAAAIGSQLADLQKPQGKSLLRDLGDALIALNDSVEAGQPVDPALEKKLNEAIDALAVYLGAVTPPPTAVDPRISALASGEGALPSVVDTVPPPPAAPPAPSEPLPVADAPEALPAAGTAPPAAPSAPQPTPAATPELPVEFARLVTDVAPGTTDEPATATSEPAPTKAATTPEVIPPALRQLGLAIGKLSEKLAPQDPELAKKLDALAETLKTGTVLDELKAALGLDKPAVERELKRIVEALATPRPAMSTPVEAKPFSTATLELPQAVTAPAKKDEPTAAVAAAPESSPASEPEIARPVAAATTAKTEKPEATDSKPAPTPAQAAQPQSAPADAAAAGTQATQPATAPVARTIHAAYQAPVQQVNLPQVAFEVVRQFEAGNSRFQIRLDPAELGRIDVRLDVDKSGAVSARMIVERPETLDLLQRDQRALQQALQQAGLDGQKTNLEFSLRQNPFAQQGGTGDGRGDHPGFNGRGDSFGGADDTAAEAATTTYRGTASASGLNLFV